MEDFRKNFPVFFSPKFWGIVITVAAIHLADSGLVSERLFEFIAQVSGFATFVGVTDSAARKISSK